MINGKKIGVIDSYDCVFLAEAEEYKILHEMMGLLHGLGLYQGQYS